MNVFRAAQAVSIERENFFPAEEGQSRVVEDQTKGGPLKESLKTDAFIAGKTRKERPPGALGIKTAGVYSFISKYVLSICIGGGLF